MKKPPFHFGRRSISNGLAIACGLLLLSCGKNTGTSSKFPVVALMTDLGSKDAYVAQLKGSLLTVDPSLKVIDLNQDVQTSNLLEASYLLDKSAASFPARSIFVVIVDPGAGSGRKPILIHTREDKYYIGPDNGIFTHVIERELVDQAIELNNHDFFRAGEISRSQQGRDIFGPVAAHLADGADFSKFGPRLKELTRLKNISPAVLGNKINAQVLHIDRFGNIITNIRHDSMGAQSKGRLLKISFKGKTVSAPFLENFSEAPADRLFCLLNSDGELEICLRDTSAAAANGVKAGDAFTIQN